ncbi:MAG: alkaline phosphatase family protein, partial [Pseudomonadota bacterium]
MNKQAAKIAVIGLDSADKDVVRQFVAAGYMPNVGKLLDESIVGETRNPYGMESGSVWPTFHTGVDPSRHGQHEAVRLFDPSTYNYRFIDETTFDQRNYWNYINLEGKRSLLIDIPYALPPEELNGLAIWDWGTHIDCKGATEIQIKSYPEELKHEVIKLFGKEPLNGHICDNLKPSCEQDYLDFRDGLLERVEKRMRIVEHYYPQGEWDFFEVVFSEPHCIGHHCWHMHDHGHPDYDPDQYDRMGSPIRDVYAAVDKQIGRIREMLTPDTIMMVYFSHGMGVDYSGTHLLDRMLAALDGRRVVSHRSPGVEAARQAWRKLPKTVRAGLKPMQRKAWNKMYADGFQPGREKRRFFEVYNNHRSGGVRINLKGREAKGIVPRDEYEAVLDELESDLLTFVND